MTDQKITGNKVNWTVKCVGFMPLEMVGDLTYAANSYTGTMTTSMEAAGQKMVTVSRYSGKRLGDCVK